MAPRLALTACPLDCPDGCTLQVAVEDDQLVRVGAAPKGVGNPLTAGYICAKVKRHAQRAHGSRRVATPLVRVGPKGDAAFRPASWDEALDIVAGRITEAIASHGPASVAPYLYNSSAGVLAANGLTPLLFEALGTSHVFHGICAATAGEAWRSVYGRMLSTDPLDVPHARLVVVWGANPAVSNTHLLPLLTEARRRGAELVVVDPRRTATAARADRWLAPRPGTDVVLALAIARTLSARGLLDRDFLDAHTVGLDGLLAAAEPWTAARAEEVCGVAAGDIEWLAETWATVRPALLRPGWGLERNRNGGAAWRAVLALPCLVGQFGTLGSGVLGATSARSLFDGRALARAVLGDAPPPAAARQLNMATVADWLTDAALDPPVRVLVVQGANPAATAPDQKAVLTGLAREDVFTLVHEQVLTDTARFADVVLPATTHFEADDLVDSYGTYTLQRAAPVIGRVGQARTNDELAAGLAVRLGLDAERFDPTPARLAAIVGVAPLPEPGEVVPVRPPEATVQFRDTFPSHRSRDTAASEPAVRPEGTGRARLWDPALAPLDYVAAPEGDRFPLALLTPATPRSISSLLAEIEPPDGGLHLHPEDAAARGIAEGGRVRVWNDLGELELEARLDADLRPGVATLPKGQWFEHGDGRATANLLAPGHVDVLAGGACFNDARVEVALL
ncbi:MAG: molybdopterin-dependent oxidoreductase [Acidimicrobiia bacterium]|nr:molybdopterin-dependent oxidoreductase [Acidimicrobiia bacterium]